MTNTELPPSTGFEGRATLIDALRGLAALLVACHHIERYAPLNDAARPCLPTPLVVLFEHGWCGVQVFFVISGFVIAYSLRKIRVTPASLGNFALRRSIRLDPPYWTTIVVVLALHYLMQLHLAWKSPLDEPDPFEGPLTWRYIGLHLVYLQGIFGYENLSVGFWTLCIEVQFYLLYACGLGTAQSFRSPAARTPADAAPWALLTVFGPLAALSLFEWNRSAGGAPVYDNEMWIIRYFCMFFLGVVTWWTLDRRVPQVVFWICAVAFSVRIAQQVHLEGWQHNLTIGLSVALATALLIYTAGRLGRLGTCGNGRVLQYLGRISYSLYLIHFPVSHIVKWIGAKLCGESPPAIVAVGWLMLSLICSVLAAHVMYRCVEAPSVRLATRLKHG
ncbi:MAG: acyltransferase [Planctomycetes bacterium]|nr:acyltransferase [Planctomycetota bacterium]